MKKTYKWRAAVCTLLVLIAVLLRFLNIDADIPGFQNADDLGDEGYWSIAGRNLFQFGTTELGGNSIQNLLGAPLSLFFHWFFMEGLGASSFVASRGVVALFSSCTVAFGAYFFYKKNIFASIVWILTFGFFPLHLLYGKLNFLEYHFFFYVFISFYLLEGTFSKTRAIYSGLFASLALVAKATAAIMLPAIFLFALLKSIREKRKERIFYFLFGFSPVLLVYMSYVTYFWPSFSKTFKAVLSYHSQTYPFINDVTIYSFWLSDLMLPLTLLVVVTLTSLLFLGRKLTETSEWALICCFVVLTILSLRYYPSYSRHFLLVFPLTVLITSLWTDFIPAGGIKKKIYSYVFFITLVFGLSYSISLLAYHFVYPTYSHRDAAKMLSVITTEQDIVAGPHNYSLSVYGQFKPVIQISDKKWAEVEVPVLPTILLYGAEYNGIRKSKYYAWDHFSKYPYHAKLTTLSYLNKFKIDVYKIFPNESEMKSFNRFRQGRVSPYDGLLFDRYKRNVETGCLLKSSLVAESRGDASVNHLKVHSGGCLGMLGFCYQTARSAAFRDIFKNLQLDSPTTVSTNLEDDRLNPTLSIKASERYLLLLKEKFKEYTDSVYFTFAAYNAGPGFITWLIKKTGKSNPSWKNDMIPLLLADDSSNYHGYTKWSDERREHKFRSEIPLYVKDSQTTYYACVNDIELQIPDIHVLYK